MADNTTKIANAQQVIEAGVRQVTNDGTTVSYDLDQLRKEVRQQMATDDTNKGRRPVISRIRLNGTF